MNKWDSIFVFTEVTFRYDQQFMFTSDQINNEISGLSWGIIDWKNFKYLDEFKKFM